MPLLESVERRRSGYRRLFENPPQIGKRWAGKFRLLQTFNRVKKRTAQPAEIYMTYDDKRSMLASVEAHMNVLLDAMATKAAYSYNGSTLDFDEGKYKFLRYAIGYKETLIGQAELIAWSDFLGKSRFIDSRYPAEELGRQVVQCFNKKQPLGACVVAVFESKDVVMKFDRKKQE